MAGRSSSEPASLYTLAHHERFIIWASRHFLWSAVRGTSVPGHVVDAFDEVGMDFLFYSLDRVLVCLMAASTEQIMVHDVQCPCLSLHEQALLKALANLSRKNEDGYLAAMAVVMLPSAARVSAGAMRLLSDNLPTADAEKLRWLAADDSTARQTIDIHPSLCQYRTIN